MTQGIVDQNAGRNVLVALGSNARSSHGGPLATLKWAISTLEIVTGPAQVSKFYQTPAFPEGAGPDFVNAVIRIKTAQPADALMALLHKIEAQADRERIKRWGQRTLDMDLLAVDDLVLPDRATLRHWIDLPALTQQDVAPTTLILPHPRIQDRSFVLVPMADVAVDWRHPVLGHTVAQMLANRPDDERQGVVAI